ncbi:MAG TPA: protein-methionine-sulfoxide reductase heme-binding subunit MsrQ [Candidatus Binatia bacterium]|jgi:sulfoxide reductase heme-binding subunit YedZ
MLPKLKLAVFILCLIPLGQLAYGAYTGDLGVNPIETITRFTGSWALIFLLASLAVTPLRRITGWNELIKLRRMIGLFAFFYASLHFSTYIVLDHFFDFRAIGNDIIKRPYVTAGFIAFVIMVPLALTSSAAMIRRLGKRWQQLHRWVYLAAITAVIHFYWLVKADISRPAQYGAVLALLLGYRLFVKWRPRIVAKQSSDTAALRSR